MVLVLSAPSYNELLCYVVIMSYYNQPLYGRLGKAKPIQKWRPISKMAQDNGKLAYQIENSTPISKMAQAIFLPGAWGKIPVFMGKNHPTPGAAMAFFML